MKDTLDVLRKGYFVPGDFSHFPLSLLVVRKKMQAICVIIRYVWTIKYRQAEKDWLLTIHYMIIIITIIYISASVLI